MNFGRRRNSRGNPDAAIDITSMIDATFILIIFLLISTTFKKKNHAFTLTLPSAAHQEVVVEVEQTSVYVTKEGELFFMQLEPNAAAPSAESASKQGERLTKEALLERVKALVERDPEQSISILAEDNTDYQKVVSTLSVLREAGVLGVQLPYEYAPGGTEAAPAPP